MGIASHAGRVRVHGQEVVRLAVLAGLLLYPAGAWAQQEDPSLGKDQITLDVTVEASSEAFIQLKDHTGENTLSELVVQGLKAERVGDTLIRRVSFGEVRVDYFVASSFDLVCYTLDGNDAGVFTGIGAAASQPNRVENPDPDARMSLKVWTPNFGPNRNKEPALFTNVSGGRNSPGAQVPNPNDDGLWAGGDSFSGGLYYTSTGNNSLNLEGRSLRVSASHAYLNAALRMQNVESDLILQVHSADRGAWDHRWAFEAGPVFNSTYPWAVQGVRTGMPVGEWVLVSVRLGDLGLQSGDRITGLAFSADSADVDFDFVTLSAMSLEDHLAAAGELGAAAKTVVLDDEHDTARWFDIGDPDRFFRRSAVWRFVDEEETSQVVEGARHALLSSSKPSPGNSSVNQIQLPLFPVYFGADLFGLKAQRYVGVVRFELVVQ